MPIELADLKKDLAAEKENLHDAEEGIYIFFLKVRGRMITFFVIDLDLCLKTRELQRKSLENGHAFSERNLALRFERQLEGSLVVKMYNIDPRDPKRQFYFSVRVEDETNLYNGEKVSN